MAHNKRKSDKRITILIVAIIILAATGLGIFLGKDKLFKPKYPLNYTASISKYSDIYNIDPYLVCAVINTESGFNKDAVSGVGAIGLMQIMPETGEWIAGKLNIDNFNSDMLFDTDTNIEFGCWYLNFLSERFNSDPELISAAYNAGHNRVWDWMGDGNIYVNGKLQNIPYKETENYVKKVIKAYEGYIKEYPDAFKTK